MPTATASSSRTSFASKRLVTDAKIILEKAGYVVHYWYGKLPHKTNAVPFQLLIDDANGIEAGELQIIGGCVDSAEVEKLLEAAK